MSDLFDSYNSFVAYFSSAEFQHTLLWVKFGSLCVSLVLIIAIIILLSRSGASWWVHERLEALRAPNLTEKLEKKWQQIQNRLERPDEANQKLAIIEADNILDEVLKRMALPGKDMGERLEQINRAQMASVDDVWSAHRLRNIIVHQSSVRITHEEVRKATEAYEKALRELEVL